MRVHIHGLLLLSIPIASMASASLLAGDLEKGRQHFTQCGACHALAAAEGNKVGPNLHGLFGRQAGSRPDFNYSNAMRTANLVWNEASLDEFLADPEALVPDTSMSFNGLIDAQSRADIIAYLKAVTR